MKTNPRADETETARSASWPRRSMGDHTALLMPPGNEVSDDEPEPEVEGAAPGGEAEGIPEEPSPGSEVRTARARPQSFEQFFREEHTNLLRAMYLVAGTRHEAEELAQEAFVKAYERWDLVRRADNPQGYLYRIGLNLYRSKLRRAARAAKKAIRPPADVDPFGAADDRDAIGRALAALPRGQREAVVMVEWLGMTDDEAGEALGISPITVRVRIHRARGTLKPILRGDVE